MGTGGTDKKQQDSVLEKWDDHCYIPIAYAIAIASQGKEVTSDKVLDGAIIAAVAPWRLYKQIYEFDPDMENVLLSQDKEDLVIPIEILKTLPYQSIYIKTSYDDYDGFLYILNLIITLKNLNLEFCCVEMMVQLSHVQCIYMMVQQLRTV